MHLNHGTEDKEVGWSGNFDILHRSDYRIQVMAIMAHHGARVNKIMSVL